ncbi:MAG: endonuclease III domain-containing protein [Planctomycetota bacterium]
MTTEPPLMEIHDRLLAAFGSQGWWPADSPTEVMVGAILVQNTAWENVERAIARLKAACPMDAASVYALPVDDLEELIKPAGTFRVKAQRLRNLLGLVVDQHGGSLDDLFALPTDQLRVKLLAVNGVGPETADSIVLYAAGKARFVVDAYTRRVFQRHGWLAGGEKYDQVQAIFEQTLPAETPLYGEYHALLVEVAKRHCKTKPRCEGCPLAPLLPEGGVC